MITLLLAAAYRNYMSDFLARVLIMSYSDYTNRVTR